MALIARSIEMSFSLSKPRRTLRSMSILAPPVPGPAELDLHPPRPEFVVVELNAVAFDVQRHGRVAGQENPAVYGRRPPRRSRPAGSGFVWRRKPGVDQPALAAAR